MSWYLLDIVQSFSFDTSYLFTEFILGFALKRSLKLQMTSWSSEATSALGKLLAPWMLDFHLLFIMMKSILFLVFPSGDSHVHSRLSLLCLNIVFVIVKLFAIQVQELFSSVVHFSIPKMSDDIFPCVPVSTHFGI